MKYYVRLGEAPPQAMTKLEVYQLIQAGRVTQSTAACPVGATEWATLGSMVPEMFQPGAQPPEDDNNAVVEIMGKAGHFIAEHSGEVASHARLFAGRILVSNFTMGHASAEERRQLESAALPVRSPMAQNYAAWRRAMLWFAGIGLGVAALIHLISTFWQIFGRHVPFIMRAINFGMVALQGAAAALILMAALKWAQISKSRRLGRWGWVLGFFGPLLLFLLPIRQLGSNREWLTFIYAQQGAEQATQVVQASDAEIAQIMQGAQGTTILMTLGLGFAMYGLFLLVPRVFGLFPGLVRACMTLRTLVPESPLPGYVLAVITPLYATLLLVIMALAAQAGSGPLFFGLVALLCSPILVLKHLRPLAKPATPEEMNQHLRPLRMKMSIATMIGVVFILAMLGQYWETLNLEWHTIASLAGQLLGNIFVVTVVAADFLLSLMRFSFDQDKALDGTALYATMAQRYADLSQVKFTQLVEEEPPPPPPAAPPAAPGDPA
jgi:hypothetical protein